MDGFDMLLINVKPRWKWFRPPLWRIFRWAYKVTKATIYKDCYPVGMGGKRVEQDPVEVTGVCYTPPLQSGIQQMYNEWLAGISDISISKE